MDVRERILPAAVELLGAAGLDGFTISAVAEAAGVSRPTVYAAFGTRDALVSEALREAATAVLVRIVRHASTTVTAADYVVEAMVAARAEFRRAPALAPIAFPQPGSSLFDGEALSARSLQLAQSFLAPVLEREPGVTEDFAEIAETCVRMLLSLIMFESDVSRSDDTLRAFLHRRLVPAIGLAPA